jgi:glutathione S-transferase
MSDVEVRPMLSGIVQGTLLHDWQEYAPGSRFTTSDAALFDELRRLGALKLENELPEAAAQALSDQQAELDRLRAEVARLTAARDAAADAEPSSKPAKASKQQ